MGTHPTHLIGYGAYGISYDAFFDPVWLAWLERGDVIAFAHVRGGGEYGEEWYRAGYKLTKQHTIDDFIACALYLIDNKYTSLATSLRRRHQRRRDSDRRSHHTTARPVCGSTDPRRLFRRAADGIYTQWSPEYCRVRHCHRSRRL